MEESKYREIIKETGAIACVPKGNSMWPTLKNGKQSVVLVSKNGRLKKFDVAMYERKDGAIVLHRIVDVVDGGYIFCGDSLAAREFIAGDGVFAVMQGFYRGNKYIETESEKFKKESENLYKNEKKRLKRANRFFFRQKVKSKIARILRRIKKPLRRKNV